MANTEGIETKVGESPISIGRFTYGARNLKVKQWDEGAALRVGSFCALGEEITIFLGGNHRIDWSTTFPFGHVFNEYLGDRRMPGHPLTRGDVVIGNDTWIAHGATIMSGVTIGDGAVVGTHAVVVKDVAPYEVVAGNPLVHIKFRFPPPIIERLLRLRWWDLPVETIREIVPDLSQAPTEALLDDLIARHRP